MVAAVRDDWHPKVARSAGHNLGFESARSLSEKKAICSLCFFERFLMFQTMPVQTGRVQVKQT